MDKLIEELTYFAYDGERDFFDITRSEAKSFLNELGKKDDEIERLNNIIEEIREYVKHKIVECYDEGSTIGEFYKICDIDSKIEELLHKGEDKE